MLTCEHCTADMDNGTLFCDDCGSDLDDPSRSQRTPPAMPPYVGGGYLQRPALERVPETVVLHLPSGKRFILRGKTVYVVGRMATETDLPDVDLAPHYGWEAGVSRTHMTIYRERAEVLVADMDSKNETIHNGYRLAPFQRYQLRDGDQLRLGGIVMRIEFQYDN